VLAVAGQSGTPDQGIFSYWINAQLRPRPMRTSVLVEPAISYGMHFIHEILAGLLQAQISKNHPSG
jgi:hypothetical protein